MYPTIPIGPLRLQTYGIFLLLAYMVGLWLAARQARRHGIEGDHVYNAGFYALLVGIVTARLGHAVAYAEVYRADPLQVLSLSPGALLVWPGAVGAAAMAAIYIYRHRLPAARMADIFAPGVTLGLAVASLGAFLAGRELGAPSELPWAVELFGVRRHPVALLQGMALLFLLSLLLWVDGKGTRRPGQMALMGLFGYATIRLFLEPLRAESALVGDGWRLAQLAALLVVVGAGWLLGRMASPAGPAQPSDETPP